VLESPWLPAFIFLAEVCVVTLSTLRTIFVARGMKVLAPLLGFFEVSIWLFAIGEVMKNLTDVRCSLAFAVGFTLGNYLGILLDQKLALGSVVVRAITHKDARPLVDGLRLAGYGVTLIDAHGATGPVEVVLTVVPRKDLPDILATLKEFDPGVFHSVDALQASAGGATLPRRRLLQGLVPGPFLARSALPAR
jgi:uncharacterized protein YebE (UPF0316 family)